MINNLISDIKSYIKYLEGVGLYISIQMDFSEYLMPLIDYYIHRNPFCLDLKSDSEMWEKCVAYHEKNKLGKDDFCIKKCHAGIVEALFGLDCNGTIRVTSENDIDKEKLYVAVKPLCRMVEYLYYLLPKGETEITENEVINRAIKYIQRNFAGKLTNHDIADFCSLSESSLCHLFKEHIGKSVHQYIIETRLTLAKKLLSASNQSIASGASKSGFSDYNYFALCFKKHTGVSPSEYRTKEKS